MQIPISYQRCQLSGISYHFSDFSYHYHYDLSNITIDYLKMDNGSSSASRTISITQNNDNELPQISDAPGK